MLAVFPSERPEYIDKYIPAENTAYVSVSGGDIYTTAYVKIIRTGKTAVKMCRCLTKNLSEKLERDRIIQRMIKNSFYTAAVEITGRKSPWGALTGIRPGKIATNLLSDGLSENKTAKYMEREYFVTPQRARFCVSTAKAGIKVNDTLSEKDVALYVGIPFCPTRCSYCSFVSQSVEKSMGLIEPFVQCLLKEIQETSKIVNELGLSVISVYFGGGTPTTLSADQLDTVIRRLYDVFDLTNVKEFTVEAGRPDTVTYEKMETLARHGITRVSINPQTMSDDVLKIIGRRHTAADIIEAYKMARKAGIPEVNMDVIAGLPGDTADGFKNTLYAVLDLEPENVTVHTLSLKKGSRITLENTELPGPEVVGEMLDACAAELSESGYEPYYLYRQKFISGGFENIGWSKEGHDSLYNILIMEELRSIISMGGGASTKLVAPKTGKIERVFNLKYPKEYIESISSVIEKKKMIADFYKKEVFDSGR